MKRLTAEKNLSYGVIKRYSMSPNITEFRTYLIPKLTDSEPIRFRTHLILNLSDTFFILHIFISFSTHRKLIQSIHTYIHSTIYLSFIQIIGSAVRRENTEKFRNSSDRTFSGENVCVVGERVVPFLVWFWPDLETMRPAVAREQVMGMVEKPARSALARLLQKAVLSEAAELVLFRGRLVRRRR
jgi:hypothetical protein